MNKNENRTERLIEDSIPILTQFIKTTDDFSRAHDAFRHAFHELEQLRPHVSNLIKRVDTLVNGHWERLEIVKACSKAIKKEIQNIKEINESS